MSEIIEPGPGWSDAISKILHEGNKPILSRAKTECDPETNSEEPRKAIRIKADPKVGCSNLYEHELKSIATSGIVQLFNIVKTVNKKSDKKKKKKKKKKKPSKKIFKKRKNK